MVWNEDPFDIFRDFERVLRDLNRNFLPEPKYRPFGHKYFGAIRPALIDLVDKGTHFELTAELPGVKKEDINLEIFPDRVYIRARRKEKIEEREKTHFYSETQYAEFRRVVPLPEKVIPSKAKAEYKNGILSLILPKEKPSLGKKGHKVKIS